MTMFWIGENYHHWCLETVYPWSRTQPDLEPSPPSPRSAEHKHKPEPTSVSIDVFAGGSLVSASRLWVPDFASAHRPSDSTMAPSSILSAVARKSLIPLALPWSVVDYTLPQKSAPLAVPRPSIPPGSVRLPAHRLSIYAPSCSTAVGWPHGVLSPSSTMAPHSSSVLSLWREVAPSWRGANCYTPELILLSFYLSCVHWPSFCFSLYN